jgi:hypothetical protein
MSDPISYMPWMVKKDNKMNKEKDELAERYFVIIEEIIKEND